MMYIDGDVIVGLCDRQVTSYGGQLTYTVMFEVPSRSPAEGLVTADVRLEVRLSTCCVSLCDTILNVYSLLRS